LASLNAFMSVLPITPDAHDVPLDSEVRSVRPQAFLDFKAKS